MSTVTYWFVTPLLHPDRHYEGPFATRDECSRRCILAMSDQTRERIVHEVLEGRSLSHVAVSFVPHPVQVAEDAARPTRRVITPMYATRVSEPHDLLAKLRALSKGKLMKIAHTLSFTVSPSLEHNKAALATRLYNELVHAAGAESYSASASDADG